MTPRWFDHYFQWAEPFTASVGGSVGCVGGRVYHLWHGTLANRGYGVRYQPFHAFGYDPFQDLTIGCNGCWEWNSDKPKMHEYVRSYFASRREDR